ncbi:hypothetical protein CP533_3984 [Ophiocordyceps camponoti-saundersi (nom. inval.)]|nr:hypothetical protein CP533_3984 [Ophiocordyceps camponoti-saundersi (nom. inval.)]
MTTAVSPTATALTPPTSSEDEAPSWAYPGAGQFEPTVDDSPRLSNHEFDMAARKMRSADNLGTSRRPSWSTGNKRPKAKSSERGPDESKWIHRDKLARIESEELQAAGIFVPPSRLLAKQRRERSQSRLAPESTPHSKSSTESASPSEEQPLHNKPAEVAQEGGANAYFVPAAGAKGGSRIPVAKLSPVPIPLDCLERGSQAVRRPVDGDGDGLAYSKPRSRSASMSVGDAASGVSPPARRSITDTSPKKNAPRKLSAASKTSTAATRPKTRSGPGKDGGRAFAKAGEPSAAGRAPEGDPPWMANSYSPDPRLPPDQQLLPTVARRLQQEKWEREGKFGDAYDKEFRPLNAHELTKRSSVAAAAAAASTSKAGENTAGDDDEDDDEDDEAKEDAAEASVSNPLTQHPANQLAADEWPLRQGAGKGLNMRQGSYSTMPKITDSPSNAALTSPRGAAAQSPPQQQQQQSQHQANSNVPKAPDLSGDDEKRKKGGCRCCIVM